MSKLVKIAIPLGMLVGSFIASSTFSFAKPDYMKREKQPCTYCHVAPNKKDLTDMGRCYAQHGHTLDNCNPKKIGGG